MIHPIVPLNLPATAKVILVGNGPSLLAAKNGGLIDAFDEVVRFNRFKLQGFEAHTGTRTTLWSTFGHGYLPGDEEVRPERVIFVYGERGEPAYEPREIYRIPKAFYNEQWSLVKKRSKRHPDHVARTGMSSGFLVAMWFLKVLGLEQITLAGFDHFRKEASRQHHYYNPRSYGRPPELDGDSEAELLAEQKTIYL